MRPTGAADAGHREKEKDGGSTGNGWFSKIVSKAKAALAPEPPPLTDEQKARAQLQARQRAIQIAAEQAEQERRRDEAEWQAKAAAEAVDLQRRREQRAVAAARAMASAEAARLGPPTPAMIAAMQAAQRLKEEREAAALALEQELFSLADLSRSMRASAAPLPDTYAAPQDPLPVEAGPLAPPPCVIAMLAGMHPAPGGFYSRETLYNAAAMANALWQDPPGLPQLRLQGDASANTTHNAQQQHEGTLRARERTQHAPTSDLLFTPTLPRELALAVAEKDPSLASAAPHAAQLPSLEPVLNSETSAAIRRASLPPLSPSAHTIMPSDAAAAAAASASAAASAALAAAKGGPASGALAVALPGDDDDHTEDAAASAAATAAARADSATADDAEVKAAPAGPPSRPSSPSDASFAVASPASPALDPSLRYSSGDARTDYVLWMLRVLAQALSSPTGCHVTPGAHLPSNLWHISDLRVAGASAKSKACLNIVAVFQELLQSISAIRIKHAQAMDLMAVRPRGFETTYKVAAAPPPPPIASPRGGLRELAGGIDKAIQAVAGGGHHGGTKDGRLSWGQLVSCVEQSLAAVADARRQLSAIQRDLAFEVSVVPKLDSTAVTEATQTAAHVQLLLVSAGDGQASSPSAIMSGMASSSDTASASASSSASAAAGVAGGFSPNYSGFANSYGGAGAASPTGGGPMGGFAGGSYRAGAGGGPAGDADLAAAGALGEPGGADGFAIPVGGGQAVAAGMMASGQTRFAPFMDLRTWEQGQTRHNPWPEVPPSILQFFAPMAVAPVPALASPSSSSSSSSSATAASSAHTSPLPLGVGEQDAVRPLD